MSGTWLQEELDILRRFHPTEGAPGVSLRTGHSIRACGDKAAKLGVRCTREAVSRINASNPRKSWVARREVTEQFMYDNGIM